MAWENQSFQWLVDFVIRQHINQLWVAFSGGRDSHSLLHWLAQHRHMLPLGTQIVAVHINHHLQSDADAWSQHCAQVTNELAIPLVQISEKVENLPRKSLEATAREVRYRAFRSLLTPSDMILTAHHADDQVETVLLALLRGAGPDGLAAMPRVRRLGQGYLGRPWIALSRQQIEAYALHHQLNFIDDPSNYQLDFARNYLRHTVTPILKRRWPSLTKTVYRSAVLTGQHAREVKRLYKQKLKFLLSDDNGLSIENWPHWSASERHLLLRIWLKNQGIIPPNFARLNAFSDSLSSSTDRQPQLDLATVTIRRFQLALYLVPKLPPLEPGPWNWSPESPFICNGFGELYTETAVVGLQPIESKDDFVLTRRQSGIYFRPLGRRHRQTLKKLFQEANVPPWWRERALLLHRNGELIAVTGLGVSADHVVTGGWQLVWKKPEIIANMPHFSRN